MSPQPLSPEIDSCRYLYLRRLWEPQDNQLCAIVDEADVSLASSSVSKEAALLGLQGQPIVVGPRSRAFQITWPRYVAYSVTNEGYHSVSKADRIASGRLLVTYEASEYLDHIGRTTFYPGVADVLGPMVHVGIYCLNHIIDVVGIGPPEVAACR